MDAKITDNPKVELLPKSTRGRFKTLEPLSHQLINGRQLYVPKGTISNGASVPGLLWGIYSPYGTYTYPSVIHDYLYENNLYTREFADRQFLIDMGKCNTNKFTKWLFYYVVRIFGEYNWNKFKKNGTTNN
jgi:hypothetical protein